ncbi:MAG: hypothetical protein PUD50_13155 [Eubacteriales bacterium]|nr:hypothetical protein [Eubacteriales bacterium]
MIFFMLFSFRRAFDVWRKNNRAAGTRRSAGAASDAFPVVDRQRIHFALFYATPTMDAFSLVYFYTHKCDPVKQGINCAQGAQKTAKRSVQKDGQGQKGKQDKTFPSEQPSQGTTHAGVDQSNGNAALQRACGTKEFAERWRRNSLFPKRVQWKRQNKDQKHNIFQQAQLAGQTAFGNLFAGNLVQQFLDKTKRTEKSAYSPAQDGAKDDEQPHNV